MDLLHVHSGNFDMSVAALIGVMLLASNFCIAVLSIEALKPVDLLGIFAGNSVLILAA